MRIAVIGGGVSGLVAASLLARRHAVTLFEAGPRLGGHANTVPVAMHGTVYPVDTGFVVFNHQTYPRFTRLLARLGVASQPTTMSFSVRCERTGLEYNGTSFNSLFAQRRNLLRPSFHRMLRDILAFNRDGPAQADRMHGASVGDFLAAQAYGDEFSRHYLVPMGAAIWSCPSQSFLRFPIAFVMRFLANHGLLQVYGRPVWHVVRGGSARYVAALADSMRADVRVNAAVTGIARTAGGVTVSTRDERLTFDEAVLACHADQALALVRDADEVERGLLRSFPYQANEAVLHTDTSVLPRAPRAWAAWNYRIPSADAPDVTVTYNMNILQRLEAPAVCCVSLNANGTIAPRSVIARFDYHHPVFTAARDRAQPRHGEMIRRARLSYCGAYWGYGFHEDGVNSAAAVGAAFGEEL